MDDQSSPDEVVEQRITAIATTIKAKREAAKVAAAARKAAADLAMVQGPSIQSVPIALSNQLRNHQPNRPTSLQHPERRSGRQRTQTDRARVGLSYISYASANKDTSG